MGSFGGEIIDKIKVSRVVLWSNCLYLKRGSIEIELQSF